MIILNILVIVGLVHVYYSLWQTRKDVVTEFQERDDDTRELLSLVRDLNNDLRIVERNLEELDRGMDDG